MGDTTRKAHFETMERDEARDFGNEQDMPVDAKAHPTLGPTEEAQDVDRLAKQIVPVPAFNDPNNPVAASGSINLSINDHPVQHSPDYGTAVEAEFGHDHVENTMSEAARSLQQYDITSADDSPEQVAARDAAANLPADREEWTKANWQTHSASLGLGTSGNKKTLQARVEDHEAAEEERAEFTKEVTAMNRADLDAAAAKYDINPEEYSTKESLTEAVIAAEFDDEIPAGDKTPSEDQ